MSAWQNEFADAFADRTVLVTGATGFTGQALCRAGGAGAGRVHGIARSVEDIAPCVVGWAVDLRDAARVDAAYEKISPELVFHLAAQVTARQEIDLVRTMCEHNLLGTLNLLLAAVQHRCRRIVLAGTPEEAPGDVRKANVASPYAAAKTAAAVYAQMFSRLYHLPVVTVRPFVTYGPGQEETKLVPYAILKFLRGESPQLSSGKRLCDFVYLPDVVRGILQAAVVPNIEGQTFDLGSGRAMSLRAAVERIAKLVGRAVPVHFGALPDRLGEKPLIADAETALRILGWQRRWSLDDGMIETIAWYAERIGVDFPADKEKMCVR